MPSNGQPCKQDYHPYLQGCYKHVTSGVTWQQARDACRQDGADLVSIHREVENAAVFYMSSMDSQLSTWIGLNDLQVWSSNCIFFFMSCGLKTHML